MRIKASSSLLPFLGWLSDTVNNKIHVEVCEVFITFMGGVVVFFQPNSFHLPWLQDRAVAHEIRHNTRITSRARLHGWHQCVCLNPADPGFPGLEPPSPPPPLHHVEALEHWRIIFCYVCRGLGVWTIRLFVGFWLFVVFFVGRCT